MEIKGFRAYFPLTFDINTTVSTWHEEMKLLIHTCASKRELVHRPLPVRKIVSRNISTFCQFVRNISTGFALLSVIGNMSTNWKLSASKSNYFIRYFTNSLIACIDFYTVK